MTINNRMRRRRRAGARISRSDAAMTVSLVRGRRLRAALPAQVVSYEDEQIEQLFPIGGADAAQRAFGNGFRNGPQALDLCPGPGRQKESRCAPVIGIGATLDQIKRCEPVEQATDSDRTNFDHFGQFVLPTALHAREIRDGAPLGLRQLQIDRTLGEFGPLDAADVVNQKAEGTGLLHRGFHE